MTPKPICIIGAGPAGLAMARACVVRGLAYHQYDANTDVGGLWDIEQDGSPMYESAHFISSKTQSGFDGLPMPEDFPDYPSHSQILTYIRAFADLWGLRKNINFKTRVTDIEKLSQGGWRITLHTGETREYTALVCATGANWHPRMPEFEGMFDGELRHSSTYRSPKEIEGTRELLVGAGNSGVDIACDAAQRAKAAFMSVRRGYHFIPKHLWGKPSDVVTSTGPRLPLWLNRIVFGAVLKMYVGDVTRLGLPKPDHKLLETHPILNTQVLHYLQHGDLLAKADVARLDGKEVVFKDGTSEEIDLVRCATGYNQVQPYARSYFRYEGGRPNLYMQLFSREHENLFAPSFVETNSGAFKLFDVMGFAIAHYVQDQINGHARAEKMAAMIKTDHPDLTGGIKFVASDRHSSYFDSHAWQSHMKRLFKQIGWTLPTDEPSVMSPSPMRSEFPVDPLPVAAE